MFIVFLKFTDNKSKAGEFMEAHNAWVQEGFNDKVFLLVGSLQSGTGGSMIAHNTSLLELEKRVNKDPFVTEGIVRSEIIEITPKMAEQRLNFLLS